MMGLEEQWNIGQHPHAPSLQVMRHDGKSQQTIRLGQNFHRRTDDGERERQRKWA
jgi:hypothetical protein